MEKKLDREGSPVQASELLLTWSWSSADYCFDSQNEMDILCKLQPHQDLQLLEIYGYRGTGFSDWVGNSSYHNMTDITLSSCKNCWMLPSLGQLPSLKKLRIGHMHALVTIDTGFHKNNDSSLLTPFPFFESLEFEDMPCWEVWSSTEPYAFPKLQFLKIENCPKLRKGLPSHLPALKELTIISCTELALQELPLSIESLRIDNSCDSLTSLSLETFPNLRDLCIKNSENLESLLASQECALQNLSSLEIDKCPNFVSFPCEGLHAPNLIDFDVSHCDKLKSLPQQMNTLLPKLEHLNISNCPEIESFPEGPCDGMKSFPKEGLLPSSLTSLRLHDFSSLETLDCKGLQHLTSLQELTIGYCPKLENIAGERLPASLTQLDIIGCDLLKESCCQKHPQVWPKISDVHNIKVQRHPEQGIWHYDE